ncbi:hypothetical protein B0H16DRAFT_1686044 [Mycena metata]|uniref:Uncharacterized protein n=1 Tax=Mycena metata TaxID=1033252 RepID=A0AAD7JRD9_9AGAR|nr:hypothetical protein B0H16DRAFT_1686044 [Mycena metata]
MSWVPKVSDWGYIRSVTIAQILQALALPFQLRLIHISQSLGECGRRAFTGSKHGSYAHYPRRLSDANRANWLFFGPAVMFVIAKEHPTPARVARPNPNKVRNPTARSLRVSDAAIGFAANLPPPTKVDHTTIPYKALTYHDADVDGTNWVGYLLTLIYLRCLPLLSRKAVKRDIQEKLEVEQRFDECGQAGESDEELPTTRAEGLAGGSKQRIRQRLRYREAILPGQVVERTGESRGQFLRSAVVGTVFGFSQRQRVDSELIKRLLFSLIPSYVLPIQIVKFKRLNGKPQGQVENTEVWREWSQWTREKSP